MIRSMSDEQIEAAEVARHGVGFDKHPHASTKSMARFATLADVPKDETVEYLPRPECIPSPICPDCNGVGLVSWMEYDGGEETFLCRLCSGEGCIKRTEANPILSAFRDEWDRTSAEISSLVSDLGTEDIEGLATPEHVADARRVLTRLRNVTEAGK